MERKRNRIFSRTGWLVITLVICFLAIVPLEAKQQGSRNSNNRSSPPPKQQQAQNTSSAPRSEAKAERPQPVSQASNSRTEARRADRDAQRAQAQAKAADQARTYEAQKQQRREIAQPVQRRTEPPRANQNQSTSSPPLARQPSQVETRDVSPREPYRPEVASNDRRSEMQPTVAIRNDWEVEPVREAPRTADSQRGTEYSFDKVDRVDTAPRSRYRPSTSITIDPQVRRVNQAPQPPQKIIVKKNIHIVQPVVVERHTKVVHVNRRIVRPVYEHVVYPEDYYADYSLGGYSDDVFYDEDVYDGGYSYYNGNGIYVYKVGLPPTADCDVVEYDSYPVSDPVWIGAGDGIYGYNSCVWSAWAGQLFRNWITPYEFYRAKFYWSRMGQFWWYYYSPRCWFGVKYSFLPF